jgi:sterol desaturase/sphingolipid hydroxylase (fatty acid hydroxylase superfamily)
MPFLNRVFVVIVVLAVLEALIVTCVPRLRHPIHWKGWFASLLIASVTHSFPLNGLLGTFYPLRALFHHGLHLVRPGTWHYWAILYLSHELSFYWWHRAGHRVPWMWLTHGVHHTSTEMTLAAGMRSVVTGLISFAFVFYVPLAVLGFRRGDIGAMNFYVLTYQTLLHTELVPRLGALEWILMTPSNHRMHHRSEAENLDKNFGGTLVVFDWIFGTLRPEPMGGLKTYGIIGRPPLDTVNPFARVLEIWGPFFRSLGRVRSLVGLRTVWLGERAR